MQILHHTKEAGRPVNWLLGLLLMVLIIQLSSCGWRLRGSYDFPKSMERVYVKGAARYSELGNMIHNALQSTNARPVGSEGQASALLMVLADSFAERVLATDSSGRASEYELTYTLGFSVNGIKGDSLVAEQRITLTREYRFDPANVLATGGEVDRLKQDMLRDAVQQMLRRINASLVTHQ